MDHMLQTKYTAYLADLRRFVLTHYPSSNRFFSMDAGRAAWVPAVAQPNVLKTPVLKTPVLQAPPPQTVAQPIKTCPPAPVPLSVMPVPVVEALLKEDTACVISPSPMPPPAPLKSVMAAVPQQEPSASHRLHLQQPLAPQPFAAGEWKQRLLHLNPGLKTHDSPPLPLGEQLWGATETDGVVLFIESAELSVSTERFVQSIQHAAKWLLAPIGCLPMHELAAWQARYPHVAVIPLRDLALYLQEPARKRQLWQELERLYHARLVARSP